ncbi:hypothetical protein HDF16_002145 [Granulicella aggregans]|uniref:Anaphase-promoting complex subunit 5 domain-containing protein n=1 Tax=Granulicella aggregans TaxID=474949 RepID=A0A7W8E3N8_9BACT|nr:hypothetical protein [Granulicella aggregans]MBB5057439.1 hypothetical protein [Granulicella aggregans]
MANLSQSETQTASISGSHNIIIQAAGNNITISPHLPHLTLIPRARRILPIQQDIDILKPECEAIPLIGRAPDQEFLRQWLQGSGIKITAITGQGGSGKTRLALDLLSDLAPTWDGGWLHATEAKRFCRLQNLSEWGWQRPTLVVIDYAAMLGESLRTWIAELSNHPAADPTTPSPDHPALRILLLERFADQHTGWYHDLADDTHDGQRARLLINPLTPRPILPIDNIDQRRQLLAAALAAAARHHTDTIPPQLPPPDTSPAIDDRLRQPQWSDPLQLLMAGVSATDGNLLGALSLSRKELAISLAKRERDRLRQYLNKPQSEDLLLHLYACTTLCGGLDRDSAIRLAKAEFDVLQEIYPTGPGGAIRDLAQHLGSSGHIPALAPDLLAEALLLVLLGHSPGLGEQVIERLAQTAGSRIAPNLIHLVQDFGYLVHDQSENQAVTAWAELALSWIDALVSAGAKEISILASIQASLPMDNLALQDVALEVAAILVEKLRASRSIREEATQILLIRRLNALSVRQADKGLWEDALKSTREAVRLLKVLAASNPASFKKLLAQSWLSLSNAESDRDMREEALHSAQQAAQLFNELADDDWIKFLPDLAGSLHNLSSRQAKLGCPNEALVNIKQAINYHRQLVERDRRRFSPYLVDSLENLAKLQGDMGSPIEALATIEEAVALSEELAGLDRGAYLPRLAHAMNELAIRQSIAGQSEKGLISIQTTVKYNQELVAHNPAFFLDRLAGSLHNLCLAQERTGLYDDALQSIQLAILHRRGLAARDPNKFSAPLALSLSVLCDAYARSERWADARAATSDCLEALAPSFTHYPQVFGALAVESVLTHVNVSGKLGLGPDWELLEPYRSIIQIDDAEQNENPNQPPEEDNQ